MSPESLAEYQRQHLRRLEAIPQVMPWEIGPSNRLAIFPVMILALRADLSECASHEQVKAVVMDLSKYEKQLLWNAIPKQLAAKIRGMAQQSKPIPHQKGAFAA